MANSALNRYGRRVPEDVIVSGFDDFSASCRPHLSHVSARQPLSEIANLAIASVLRQIDHRQNNRLPQISHTNVDAPLVIRSSDAKVALKKAGHRTNLVESFHNTTLQKARENLYLLLASAKKLHQVKQIFQHSFAEMGLPRTYVILYQQPNSNIATCTMAQLALAHRQNPPTTQSGDSTVFPTSQRLPRELRTELSRELLVYLSNGLCNRERHTMVIC